MMTFYIRKKLLSVLTCDANELQENIEEVKAIIKDYETAIAETPNDKTDKIENLNDMIQVFRIFLEVADEVWQFTDLTGEPLSEYMRKYEIKNLCDKFFKEMNTR